MGPTPNKQTNKQTQTTPKKPNTHTHLYQRQHLGKQKPQQALALNKSVQSVKNARPHDEEVSVQCSRVGCEGLGQCFPWRGRRTPSGLPRSGGRWLRCTRTPRKKRNRSVTKRTRPTNLSLSLSLSILCLTQSLASFQRRRIGRGTARSCGSRWWSSGLSARGSVTL